VTPADDARPRSRARQLLESLEDRRAAFRDRHVLYRSVFVVLGVAVTLAGFAMLVLPGPAIVVIPVGLAMLALQFDWAERALERAVDQAERAADAASASSPVQRVLVGVAVAVAAAALAVWAYVGDVPFLPV